MNEKARQIRTEPSKVLNIPNTLTLFRILLSVLLVIFSLKGFGLWTLIMIFCVAALTDAADGFIARRFNRVTNFGRKFDLLADRIFAITIVAALLIYAPIRTSLTLEKFILILLIMSREIASTPFAIALLFIKSHRKMPHGRTIGKITTIFQALSFLFVIFGWSLAIIPIIFSAVLGIITSCYFAYDSIINPNNKVQLELDREYEKLNQN